MNILLPLAAIMATLATPSSAPLPNEEPSPVIINAVYTTFDEPVQESELLMEIGSDGELGGTCWTYMNGEIARSGIIKPDGTIVYDDAPDYSRCTPMD
jgi:hypothetical protein